jgi:hypothetical protein
MNGLSFTRTVLLVALLSAWGGCQKRHTTTGNRATGGTAGTTATGGAGTGGSGGTAGSSAGTSSDGGTAGGAVVAGSAGSSGETSTGGGAGEGGEPGNGGEAGGGGDAVNAGRGGGGSGGNAGAGKGGGAGKGRAGGSSGSLGFAGAGGKPPIAEAKVDLLFMIDTSISMGENQKEFSDSLPFLLNALTSDLGITDLHVGMITSSIGDHGSGDVCSPASASADSTYNDLAQLLPSVRLGVPSWDDQGFLVWDPGQTSTPPGEDDIAALAQSAQAQLEAAGDHGCGYEAQLESLYRFLVDPEPVGQMANDGDPGAGRTPVFSLRGATNQMVLAQRAAFLRPDSTLVIVLLTDENDCSILDENQTQGWLVPFKGGPMVNNWRMPRAATICETAPNDPGCVPTSTSLTVAEDAPNMRCFHQKQRFGIDLLYPVSRYIDALSAPEITPRLDGAPIPNPLFFGPGGDQTRDPSQVFVLGIVGVPWQDLTTSESWTGAGVEYLSSAALTAGDRWDILLGDPAASVPPTDPMMLESIDPRPVGTPHPLLGNAAAVAPEDSTDPTENAINGHEQAVIQTERADLQFACIFPLPAPIPCTQVNEDTCDCNADEYVKNSPLCSYSAPNTDGTQLYGKAYPGIRELQVLKGLGDQAVVTSLCAKNAMPTGSPATDPDYGYNPAMTALIEALRQAAGP